MPPKASGSKKTEEKKKAKNVEDKTFGLKNKNKSKSVQKYIASVQQSASGNRKRADLDPTAQRKEKKEAEKAHQAELAQLFKPVVQQPKIAAGVDPKSVICQFFKLGQCTKGSKCKFSHDITVERKAEKLDIYQDRRDGSAPTGQETMENWNLDKLQEVVSKKQTSENNNLPTEIVCKYFLEAIENKKYGWFWECPNGGLKCMYRHALPPGFVLKTKKEEVEEEEEEIPIEDLIEEERKNVKGVTPVTLETFLKWKAEKDAQRAEVREAEKKERYNTKMGMTGRDLFEFNPEIFVDDLDAGGAEDYEQDEERNSDSEDDSESGTRSGDGHSASNGQSGQGSKVTVETSWKVEENLFEDDDAGADEDDLSDDDEDQNTTAPESSTSRSQDRASGQGGS